MELGAQPPASCQDRNPHRSSISRRRFLPKPEEFRPGSLTMAACNQVQGLSQATQEAEEHLATLPEVGTDLETGLEGITQSEVQALAPERLNSPSS